MLTAVDDGQVSFRVGTLNTGGVTVHGERINKVADFLKCHQPDVICLQEIDYDPLEMLAEKLQRETGRRWCQAFAAAAYCGNGVLTRHPIAIVWHDFCELFTGTSEMRSAVRTILEIPPESEVIDSTSAAGVAPKRVAFVATHLDWEIESERLRQTNQLLSASWAEESDFVKEEGFLLCGDLNAVRRGDYTDERWEQIAAERRLGFVERPRNDLLDVLMKNGFRDSGSECPKDALWTTSRFQTRIDYVLASSKFSGRLTNHHVVDAQSTGVTDHNMVVVDVCW